MTGVLIVVKAALVLWACCMVVALRNRLRESEQIRDALVTAVHECRAEIARLRITDAEREAIEWASLVLRNTAEELDQHGDYPRRLNEAAALMLNLLQRLK